MLQEPDCLADWLIHIKKKKEREHNHLDAEAIFSFCFLMISCSSESPRLVWRTERREILTYVPLIEAVLLSYCANLLVFWLTLRTEQENLWKTGEFKDGLVS